MWIPVIDADTVTRPRSAVVTAGPPRTLFDSAGVLVSVTLSDRLPTSVELSADHLYWTIYGASWAALPAALAGDGRTVRRIVASDSAPERLVLDVQLAAMPLGWRTEWHDGALHLRLRPVPPRSASSTQPLRGLVVALDPGHPPDGTIGPSRLHEDSATLAVATVAAERLRALGATVQLTRTDRAPVSLEARALIAEQSAAQLFISIHLNAPGAGRPPEAVHGTQTYWMHPNARTLSAMLLTSVAGAMEHPALGSYQGEFAVLRPAWAVSVLVEGSGIVLPEREAFLRTPAGIGAYAQGIVDGVVRWMASTEARQMPVQMYR